MEKHKCKLCARTFSNGRALGGHMKGHLATHPLPPKTTTTKHHHHHQLADSASSSSSSSGDEEQELEQERSREVVVEEKCLVYGLRENPKKSSRFADPEFSFAVAGDFGSVVQDRESETESRNPTRRRSKRNRKVGTNTTTTTTTGKPSLVESPPTEPEPVSSVSDTSPEENVAMCLMMLSRDVWKSKSVELYSEDEIELLINKSELSSKKKKNIRGKYRCGKCKKSFRSYPTLDEHKRLCSDTKNAGKVSAASASAAAVAANYSNKIFECPFCYRVFGSGQALGGHKRSHLLAAASSSKAPPANSSKFHNNLIDLNLPAPMEDDEFSVVSDA
ncbi:hypothetical protein PTKIN_Ptkin04bG0209700 [Pterospermum kingtungense]